MAACASCLIWFSSRSRVAEAWFLVVGIAFTHYDSAQCRSSEGLDSWPQDYGR